MVYEGRGACHSDVARDPEFSSCCSKIIFGMLLHFSILHLIIFLLTCEAVLTWLMFLLTCEGVLTWLMHLTTQVGPDSYWFALIKELDKQRARGYTAVQSPLLWSMEELQDLLRGRDCLGRKREGLAA